MTTENVAHRKRTGSHFTPSGLAQFVAQKILEYRKNIEPTSNMTVLDPACGDGELLLALTEVFPTRMRRYMNLIGIDSNSAAFQNARLRLQSINARRIDLRKADFLEHCTRELSTSSCVPGSLIEKVDIIIANPPYVRTQILGAEKSQKLASVFNLSGRIDLYHAFLAGMRHCLKIDGIMGVITSNRFISTKSGNAIRALLASEFEILELIDLGDTKLFQAAVLPAVIIARRRQPQIFNMGQTSRFVKIYETLKDTEANDSDNVYVALQSKLKGVVRVHGNKYRITTGTVDVPCSGKDPWVMVSDEEKAWLQHIYGVSKHTVSDVTKVRVGVKTTADKVFIRQTWDSLPQSCRPESELLFPLISASDTSKWNTFTNSQSLKRILYPHITENGCRSAIKLEEYPRAAMYLENHSKKLKAREYLVKSNRNWYEIWVPQDPSAWENPKIVFPDISSTPHFLFDSSGAVVDGNCYWMMFNQYENHNWLYLILGIANSKFMTKFHDLSFNNKLYSGRRRYLTQYVEKYPLPDLSSKEAQTIVEIVRGIVTDLPNEQDITLLEDQLDTVVMDAYNIDFIPMD